MSMPRCPRCAGLLVLTAQEDKPIRCVNCAGRFDYMDVTGHKTMTTERKRHGTSHVKKQEVLSRST